MWFLTTWLKVVCFYSAIEAASCNGQVLDFYFRGFVSVPPLSFSISVNLHNLWDEVLNVYASGCKDISLKEL